MKSFLSVAVAIICFTVFFGLYWLWSVGPLVPRQKKPPVEKPTMFDVRRLLKEGQRDAAIRCYAQIFKVSSARARKDVDQLERSLKV